MTKFRKKPIIIEAIQWTGQNLEEIYDFMGLNPLGVNIDWICDLVDRDGLTIKTLEGSMKANITDWIIKGIKGECYPCRPDIFKETYEPVEL